MRSQGAAVYYGGGARVTTLVVHVDRGHALGELNVEGQTVFRGTG
jgi:hypothetical protein